MKYLKTNQSANINLSLIMTLVFIAKKVQGTETACSTCNHWVHKNALDILVPDQNIKTFLLTIQPSLGIVQFVLHKFYHLLYLIIMNC